LKKIRNSPNFTGVCICDHSFDDHHHGYILNSDALKKVNQEYRNVDGILAEECEATQFEGRFTPDVTITHGNGKVEHRHYDKKCECNSYWDKGWPKQESD